MSSFSLGLDAVSLAGSGDNNNSGHGRPRLYAIASSTDANGDDVVSQCRQRRSQWFFSSAVIFRNGCVGDCEPSLNEDEDSGTVRVNFVPLGKSSGKVGTKTLPSYTTSIRLSICQSSVLSSNIIIAHRAEGIYGVSTVIAMTMGALRSGPFTRSMVLIAASRFGVTAK